MESANIFSIENKYKKEMIDYNHNKKLEIEQVKMEMFERKQKIMNNNTAFLWNMKEKYLQDVHNKQMKRMELYWKIKKDLIEKDDFKNAIENKRN